ncbi:MAG: terminase small subunit [Ruminococcus sp.]|nr:terminase small subunit [Ruminococcus sp.]
MSQLNKKEKAFCREYLESGNAKKAARSSGITKDPYELLSKEAVISEIKRLGTALNKNSEHIARSALIRLAVGDVSDACRLLIIDKPDEEILSELDLFMVSEIKRKGDTTEIKFYDRFKAIKCLLEGFESEQNAVPFYEALIAGAEKLNNSRNGD